MLDSHTQWLIYKLKSSGGRGREFAINVEKQGWASYKQKEALRKMCVYKESIREFYTSMDFNGLGKSNEIYDSLSWL